MPIAPFPRIPDSLRRRYCAEGLFLCGFGGELEDLEPDFGGANRARLERDVLACCARLESGESLPGGFFRDLEVGKRTEALLLLAELTTGRGIDAEVRCANPACGEAMEVELGAEELSALQRAAENAGPPLLTVAGEQFPLRRPTGADEEAWRRADGRDLAQSMAESLVVDEFRLHFRRATARDKRWLEEANRVMGEADPLVDFRLRLNCPFCATQESYRVDLAELSLRRFRSAQQALIVGVHRLATRYHWSEREIFEVPTWRRRMYLALLDNEASR
jgi:hypothetical protein